MANLVGVNLSLFNNPQEESAPNLSGVDTSLFDEPTKSPKRDKKSRRETNPTPNTNNTNIEPNLNGVDLSAFEDVPTSIPTFNNSTGEVKQNEDDVYSNLDEKDLQTEKVDTNIEKKTGNIVTLSNNNEEQQASSNNYIFGRTSSDSAADPYKEDSAKIIKTVNPTTGAEEFGIQLTKSGRILDYKYSEQEARKFIENNGLKVEENYVTPQQFGESLFIPTSKSLKLFLPLSEEERGLDNQKLREKLFFKGLENVVTIMSGGLLSGEDKQRVIDKVYNHAVETGQFNVFQGGSDTAASEEDLDKVRTNGGTDFYFNNKDFTNIIRDEIFAAKERVYEKNPSLKQAEIDVIEFEKNYGYENYDTLNQSLGSYLNETAWDFKRGLYKGLIRGKTIGYRTAAGLMNTLVYNVNPLHYLNEAISYVAPDYYKNNIKPYTVEGLWDRFGFSQGLTARANAIDFMLSNLDNKGFMETFTEGLTTAGESVLPIIGLSYITKNPSTAMGIFEALQSSGSNDPIHKQLLKFAQGYALGNLLGKTNQFGKVGSAILQGGFGAGQEAVSQAITHGRIVDTQSILVSGLTQSILDVALSGRHEPEEITKFDFTKDPPEIPTNINSEKGLPLAQQGETIFNQVEANKLLGKGGLSQQYEGVVRLNIADARQQLNFLLNEVDNLSGKDKEIVQKAIDDLTKGLEIQINNQYLTNTMNPAKQLTGKSYSREDIDNLVFLHDSIAEARLRDIDKAIANGDLEKARQFQEEHLENAQLAELYSRGYDVQYLENNPEVATSLLDENLTVEQTTNRPDTYAYNAEGNKKTNYARKVSLNTEEISKELSDLGIQTPKDNSLFNLIQQASEDNTVDVTSKTPELVRNSNNPLIADILANNDYINKNRLNTSLSPANINLETGEAIHDILPTDSQGNVLNSGLNPHAFIQQAKLLYKGLQDLKAFTEGLVSSFGEVTRPIVSKLFSELQRLHNNEIGALSLGILPTNSIEYNNFVRSENSAIARGLVRKMVRMTGLAQWNPQVRDAIFDINKLRGFLRGKESQVLAQIHKSNELLKSNNEGKQRLAEVLYYGNEKGIRFRDITHIQNETGHSLSNEEFESYRALRSAQDITLDLRMQQKLVPIFESLNELINNGKGTSKEANEYRKRIAEVRSYYQTLKDSGYISLQRRGKYAVSAIDPTKPVGSNERLIYQQVNNRNQLKAKIKEFKNLGFTEVQANSKIMDFANLRSKLTPAQFERMVIDSGADPFSPEVETIRKEVRSKYATTSYEIKRNFIRGYDISYDNAIATIGKQIDVYKKSYYSDIGYKYGMKNIDRAGIDRYTVVETNPNLLYGHPDRTTLKVFEEKDINGNYDEAKSLAEAQKYISNSSNKTKLISPDIRLKNFLSNYIKDETSPYSSDYFSRASGKLRTFTAFMQLGFDVSQYVLNGVYQQVVMANPYFARNGLSNIGIEPEVYFGRAWKFAGKLFKGTASPEAINLYKKATAEGYLEPQFTQSLVHAETGEQTRFEKINDYASWFMQKGEKTGRTHTFAEAYLVGTEKLNLKGDKLYNYITDAIDNINQRFTKAENPELFRSQFGRLFYQFNSYTSAYLENLALSYKHDLAANKGVPLNLARTVLPVMLAGGLSGLPFYRGFRQAYTLMSDGDFDEDLKNGLQKRLGENVKNLVMYGASTKQGVSNKLGINVPVIDNSFDFVSSMTDALHITRDTSYNKDSALKIPAVSTILDTSKGIANLGLGTLEYKNEGESDRLNKAIEQVLPRSVRGIVKSRRFFKGGVTNSSGEQIIDPSEMSITDKLLQGINVTPQPVLDYYTEQERDRIKKVREKLLEKFGQ